MHDCKISHLTGDVLLMPDMIIAFLPGYAYHVRFYKNFYNSLMIHYSEDV